MPERDDRPFYALVAALALVALAFLVPASRAWLLDVVVGPIRTQAGVAADGEHGYTLGSLLFWAILGGIFAWAAYEAVFVRWRFAPDRAFFAALAPALLLGPLLHAALVARVIPEGSPVAFAAAEPVVYLTIAAFAFAGLALGRVAQRPVLVPLAWGALAIAPLLWFLAPGLSAEGARLALVLLALALAPAVGLAIAYVRWRGGVGDDEAARRPVEPLAAVVAVIGAHALDGATTWMVLRDPFGFGFEGFGERNPVSETLVGLSNGWPYFALKLALPVVLLAMVGREDLAPNEAGERDEQARLRAFLLFAVFILGFGPGMANLLQVLFS